MLSFLFSSSRRRLGPRALRLLLLLFLAAAAPLLAADRPVEKRMAPEYPVLALRMRITGVVKVVATVAADGHVTAAKADHGNSLLMAAAEAAVRKWKFAAADAPSTETVTVNFEIGN